MLSASYHLPMDHNKLLVSPKYRYTKKSVRFNFSDLPDEVIELILYKLSQHDLLQVLTVNYRIFKLAKAQLYRNILVYNPSLHARPKSRGGNSTWVVNPIRLTLVSHKNFLKLMNSYTFEPELTERLFLKQCNFSKSVIQDISRQFCHVASWISEDKVSYANEVYQCDFEEHSKGSNLIQFDVRTRIPSWVSIYDNGKTFDKAFEGLQRNFCSISDFTMEYCVSLDSRSYSGLDNLRSLSIHGGNSLNLNGLNLVNLRSLMVPSNIIISESELPHLNSLTVIEANRRSGFYSLLKAIKPNQLAFFHYYDPLFGNGSSQLPIDLRVIKSQSESLQTALFYCINFENKLLSMDVFPMTPYKEEVVYDYEKRALSFLETTLCFLQLNTLGLPKHSYHVKSYDTIREFEICYEADSQL